MRFTKFFLVLALGTALIGASISTSVSAQEIGKVASISPQMQGQAPGAGLRTLRSGSGVVADHRIITGANGRGQLLFLDETTLSVASRSEVILDRFVYDPNRGAGEIGLSLTRGALRFIGGKATDNRPAEITTPTGTISIRGSSALVLVQNGRTIVVFVAGERLCFAVAGGKRHCTNRRGGMLGEDGYMGKVSKASLAQLIARIDGPVVRGTPSGTAGSGIAGQNPSNRNPLSTTGETYDIDGPDANFGDRPLEGLLSEGDPVEPVEDDPVMQEDPIVEEPNEEPEEEFTEEEPEVDSLI